MGNNSEVFSNDIRWQLLAVSPDMMDTTQGNTNFPFAWRSSLAIYGAVPPTEEQINDFGHQFRRGQIGRLHLAQGNGAACFDADPQQYLSAQRRILA